MGSSILGVKNKMMSQDGSRAMFHVLALLLQKNLPQAPSFTKNKAKWFAKQLASEGAQCKAC